LPRSSGAKTLFHQMEMLKMRTVQSFAKLHRFCCGLAFLTVAVAIAGCGGESQVDLAPVTGTVTQDEKPVSGASVMFNLQGGGGSPSGGETDASGHFELKFNDGRPGAIPGKHGVTISIPGAELPAPEGGDEEPDREPGEEFHKEAEVKAGGENNFTFDVSK
jgi:hypothetical protein